MDSELPTANLRLMNQEFVKLDRFDGQNYTRWADKVKFMLIVLKLYYVLDPELAPIPEKPVPKDGKEVDQKTITDLEAQRLNRKEAEDLCLGHIKNSLSDRLYDLYAQVKSPKELWKALELKYKAHEDGTNKYLIAKYLDFQMVDEKSILEQVHELQVLVKKLTSLSIPLPEIFQVGVIIAKLPPSWKDFFKRMMHKSEDYSLDELLKHLRIEEETRNLEKRGKVGTSVHHLAAGSSGGSGGSGGSGQKGKSAQKWKKPWDQKSKCLRNRSNPTTRRRKDLVNAIFVEKQGIMLESVIKENPPLHPQMLLRKLLIWWLMWIWGLVSADKFDRNGFKLVIKDLKVMFSRGSVYVGRAVNRGGMYHLELDEDFGEESSVNGGVSVIDISSDSDDEIESVGSVGSFGSASTRASRVSGKM
ncbi:hypothetical protein SSX86_024733 [Deinandra increscens subsp. villosa]|uniref:Uncharacterized protein n=1 Tax=Deinandra increscens subsp. villosa TaxID=3103831 RepID=A0AAP0CB76_9ASTR